LASETLAEDVAIRWFYPLVVVLDHVFDLKAMLGIEADGIFIAGLDMKVYLIQIRVLGHCR